MKCTLSQQIPSECSKIYDIRIHISYVRGCSHPPHSSALATRQTNQTRTSSEARRGICYRTYASRYTHTHTHSHTYIHTHMHILCMFFLCTLTFLHTSSDSNLAEWQLLALFLPDFTCLFNKLFSFSLFPSSLLSVLFSAVLFCLFTHSAAAFEAQLKYLSNFYRRTLSVQIVCCLLQTYCKYTPCTHPLAGWKSFLCANCSLLTAYGVEHHKCQATRAWHAKRLKVLQVLKVAWVIVLGTPTLWLCACVCVCKFALTL